MAESKIVNIVMIAAILLVVVSVGFTYFSIKDLDHVLTAYGVQGEVNLSVESSLVINFTTASIDYGSGRVNSDASAASLTTFSTNNVTGGNWTLTTAGGLRLQNEGNTNVSINLTFSKNASEFLGGTGSAFEFNVTNFETGSCLNGSGKGAATGGGIGGLRLNVFYPANTTSSAGGGGFNCNVLRYESTSDVIRIDFNLTIPQDIGTGSKNVNISAVATAFNPTGSG